MRHPGKDGIGELANSELITLRLTQNLTQQQVADLAHISRAYYVAIENGRAFASIPIYKSIARALGYSSWKDLIPENID